MQYIVDNDIWTDKISLIEKPERVVGGVGGVANRHAQELGDRTKFLKTKVGSLELNKADKAVYNADIAALKAKDAAQDVAADNHNKNSTAHADIRTIITTNKTSADANFNTNKTAIAGLTTTVTANKTAAETALTAHNTATTAHADIRTIITTNKTSADANFNTNKTAIAGLTTTVTANKTAAETALTAHNTATTAHADIRTLITTNKTSADANFNTNKTAIAGLTTTVTANKTAAETALTAHNTATTAHADIRTLITTNKTSADANFNTNKTAIAGLTTTVTANKTAAETALTAHNTATTAHTDIRALITTLTTAVNYNRADARKMGLAICPVGSVMTSFSATRPPKYWLPLNGEWFDTVANAELYNYGKACVPPWPITTGKMQLPDMRGTVARMQNLGRFADVVEIGLGQYQADATQRVTGFVTSGFSVFDGASGAFRLASNNGGRSGTTVVAGQDDFDFDNARLVRTALEERVKATGVYFYIFAGLGNDYK